MSAIACCRPQSWAGLLLIPSEFADDAESGFGLNLNCKVHAREQVMQICLVETWSVVDEDVFYLESMQSPFPVFYSFALNHQNQVLGSIPEETNNGVLGGYDDFGHH